MKRFAGFFLALVHMMVSVGLFATAMLALHIGYLTFMPFSWWISYDHIRLIPGPPTMVELDRNVSRWQGPIPYTRFTYLLERRPDGISIKHCPASSQTTAESETNPGVRYSLADFLGPYCDLSGLSGKRVSLMVVWSIRLAYNINKTRTVEIPVVVNAGRLVEAPA